MYIKSYLKWFGSSTVVLDGFGLEQNVAGKVFEDLLRRHWSFQFQSLAIYFHDFGRFLAA